MADAIRADAKAAGETLRDYARRRGVPVATAESWLLKPPKSSLAKLLAEEISGRLDRS